MVKKGIIFYTNLPLLNRIIEDSFLYRTEMSLIALLTHCKTQQRPNKTCLPCLISPRVIVLVGTAVNRLHTSYFVFKVEFSPYLTHLGGTFPHSEVCIVLT